MQKRKMKISLPCKDVGVRFLLLGSRSTYRLRVGGLASRLSVLQWTLRWQAASLLQGGGWEPSPGLRATGGGLLRGDGWQPSLGQNSKAK
jgi:hypothetical protein